MPALKGDPFTGQIWIEASVSELAQLARHLFGNRSDRYINYSPDWAKTQYQESGIQFVEDRSKNLCAPYQILFDYRSSPYDPTWGSVSYEDQFYSFPAALATHKTVMTKDFERRKLLKKGNQLSPRIKRFETKDGTPHFVIQEAHYYDQVGTNLSLDYPFDHPVKARGFECQSVREWDIVQAFGSEMRLPGFEESRLANTLGVAIGVSARSRDGQTYWLRRKRSKGVAVYADMWHLPFSFALCLDEESKKATDLKSLIRFDLGHERAQELGGLEHSDFGELKPIAFCRDLARGGKPQLFFELPCLVPFERLRRQVQEENTPATEFSSKIETVREGHDERHYSSELACFLLLART